MTADQGSASALRVLIAGCGDVGTKLGLLLAGGGAEVWGLRRTADTLPPPIRQISADLLSPRLAEYLPRVDRVVYATAADASTPQGYRAAYLDGVQNLLGALARSGSSVERLLFLSSTAVYGEAGGAWVDEDTTTAPEGFRGEILLSGEAAVRNAPDVQSRIVLRLGGIYGPTRTGLVERVRSGRAQCTEGVVRWSNRIHRDDAAGAALHLLLHPSPEPLYLGVDNVPAPICDVYRFVARELGVPAPRVVPQSGGAHTSPAAAPERVEGKRCSNRRLRESGHRLHYPSYRDGYSAMLESDARSATDPASAG